MLKGSKQEIPSFKVTRDKLGIIKAPPYHPV